jgi:hypothetical protein
MIDISTILRAARAKIEREECWTCGKYAKDARGDKIGTKNPEAVCWCALGALMSQGVTHDRAAEILDPHVPPDYPGVLGYNDYVATHTDILALFTRAIEAAEAQGK